MGHGQAIIFDFVDFSISESSFAQHFFRSPKFDMPQPKFTIPACELHSEAVTKIDILRLTSGYAEADLINAKPTTTIIFLIHISYPCSRRMNFLRLRSQGITPPRQHHSGGTSDSERPSNTAHNVDKVLRTSPYCNVAALGLSSQDAFACPL
ncbi:hypothetical protein T11_9657 [Trichinella zimbabwensis]|uniref:Uncharacterized protein n=1 Tax=Trichinella zimbabwensis TaxID=268475 RepID=A0A0V1HSE2_9BILA|nr:hypothetical protein T11_9657 [Trichinella zimbabwensis]